MVGPEAHGAAIARNPVLVSGYASSTLPTAVDAADVCRMWTSLNGSVVVSGYNEDPATPVTALLPIGTDNVACSQAAPQLVRTGGEARASGGALTEGDSALFSTDLYGGLRVAGGSPHGAAAVQNPVLVGGFCTASIPTALDENDAGHSWHNLNGIQIVGGLLEDGALNYGVGLPIGRDNAVGTDTTPDLVKVGGQARAGGAAYLEGDSVVESFDLVGGLRVAGSVAHGVAATGNPLLCGAYASDVIQAATTAGYASRLWASLNGALCIAGLYQHATPASAIAKTIPVVVDDAIMFTGATAFPVAGQYNATALTYTDKDATVLQTNVSGALITTGGVGGGTPYYGRKTIATPGTEEALHAGQAILNGFAVSVKALQTNTNPVYVGANGLTSATGYPLYPGEEISLAVTNLNLIYLDVTTAGEGVAFIVES